MTCDLNSWTTQSASVQSQWRKVAFGTAKFIAVSRGVTENATMNSPDGVTWTSHTPAANQEWFSVAHRVSDGRTMAVSQNGPDARAMFSDDDGDTWTLATSGSTGENWTDVTYDETNSRWIAVGPNNDRCMNSSNNGVAWTSRTIQTQSWRSVFADHGTAIAVGDSGAVSKSTDGGVTWTAKTAAAANHWSRVRYSSRLSRWIAIGQSGTGNRVMTSDDDGDTWTSRTSAADYNWSDITEGSNKLVCVTAGNSPPGNEEKIQYSTDGITWTLATGASARDWQGITFGLATFVAVGLATGLAPGVLLQVETVECTQGADLTGVSATGSRGTLTAARTLALSGVAATGSVGTLNAIPGLPLGGVSAAGAVGSLGAVSTTVALSGVSGTGSPGTLVATIPRALTGVAATGAVGSLSPGDNIAALSGVAAAGAVGTLGVTADTSVTIALTGVAAGGLAGILVASGGSFPSLPFSYQLLEDGPRYAIIRVAPNIDVDLPVSLLVDPQNLASIIPGWPTGLKATRLAIFSVQYSTPAALVLDLWWAGPTPVLALTLNGTETEDFSAKGGLQNNAAGTAGQILLSTRGLAGNQSFSLALKLVKQGGFA